MKIKVKVPATTANLGPGYDCLGAALELYNEFEVFIGDKLDKNFKIQIEVIGEGADFISKDEKNIVYQAIKKVCQINKKEVPNISLKIFSKIPAERGLGSSASARVAGVVIGNILCDEKFSCNELINIATELEGHPDNVVPAMVGGLCVSKKIDDYVKYIKFVIPKDLVSLILVPNIKIPTEKARNILPQSISFNSAVRNVSNVTMLLSAILKKEYSVINFAMEDFIHQPFRKKLMPWLEDIFDICLKNGALGVALSGSGSSVFALYKRDVLNKALSKKIKSLIEKKVKLKIENKILNFINSGVKIFL
jgi:homoserine kinase